MVSRITIKAILAIICLLPLGLSANTPKFLTAEISFFSQQLPIRYSPDFILDTKVCARISCIKDFYQDMEETGYQMLLDDLATHKEQLNLNDWLYNKLLVTTLDQLYEGKKFNKRNMHFTLTSWFLMSKAGYDTKLTEAALAECFLYVSTHDKLYGIPTMRDNNKTFVNLTAATFNWDTRGTVYRKPKYNPFKDIQGKTFSFMLDELPALDPDIVKKSYTLKYKEEEYTIEVDVDQNPDKIMKSYPLMMEQEYIKVPLSSTLSNSLVTQLKPIIEGKTEKEAIEIITKFTRSCFTYKWDWDAYDDNLSFIPDQVFINEFSDHEDRSALFYSLVKELLDLPMVIIKYYDYITVGVAMSEEVGTAVEYKDKSYYICDPTSPSNSSKIGRFPNGCNTKTMEIIGATE